MKLILLFLLWISSFIIFYFSFAFSQDSWEDISYSFLKEVDDFESFYKIDFKFSSDYDLAWTFSESFSSNSTYNYEFAMHFDIPKDIDFDFIPISRNIYWTFNFRENTTIDNFFISLWENWTISWQTAVWGEDRILISYEKDWRDIFSQVFDTVDINMDLLFTRFLPYMDFDVGETVVINTFSPFSFLWKDDMKNQISLQRKDKEKYKISSWFMWLNMDTNLYFEDGILIKQENPFFSYNKQDNETSSVDFEESIDINDSEEDTYSEDEPDNEEEEEDLECKLIWHD